MLDHSLEVHRIISPVRNQLIRNWGGLFTRRERRGLSLRGWLSFIVCLLGAGVLFVFTIHPFLAVSDPVATDTLVVEGWVHDFGVRAGVDEFNTGKYKRIFATGGPVRGSGAYTDDYGTLAHVGASNLKADGIPPELIQKVPAHYIGHDRTFASAVALREWLQQNRIPVASLNVVTESVHARRTRLLFQKALGPAVKVGIIAARDPDYDPRRWWQYSEGVREVIGETIAYLYAKLFFHPSTEET